MNKEVTPREQSALPKVKPVTDILERKDGFHIYMDMPGVVRDDLTIDLNDNELSVHAKAVLREGTLGKDVHVEFGSVEYIRNFTISDVVDGEKIEAKLKNGVLELFLPKAEKAVPKRIEIKSA